MEIREFLNGTFQVWHNNKILMPCSLNWEPSFQSGHDFMYFRDIKKAKQAITDVLNKEKGETVVAIHKVEITEIIEIKHIN